MVPNLYIITYKIMIEVFVNYAQFSEYIQFGKTKVIHLDVELVPVMIPYMQIFKFNVTIRLSMGNRYDLELM